MLRTDAAAATITVHSSSHPLRATATLMTVVTTTAIGGVLAWSWFWLSIVTFRR